MRILRIPAVEAEQFTRRVLRAVLFGDGSAVRVEGAVRAGRSLEDQRLILLPPAEVRAFDALLASLDERWAWHIGRSICSMNWVRSPRAA